MAAASKFCAHDRRSERPGLGHLEDVQNVQKVLIRHGKSRVSRPRLADMGPTVATAWALFVLSIRSAEGGTRIRRCS